MIEGRSLKLLHGLTSSMLLSLERANALLFTRLIATFTFSAEIFLAKFRKSLAKQFLEVAIRKSYMLNTNGNKGEKVVNVKSYTL